MLDGTASSVSAGIPVSDFKHCILSITGSSAADLKVYIKGAIKRDDTQAAPNFNIRSSARSRTDHWDFMEVIDLEDGTVIDGDDGVSLSGNIVRLIEVNINSLDWLAVEATAITAGTVTVVGAFTTNE